MASTTFKAGETKDTKVLSCLEGLQLLYRPLNVKTLTKDIGLDVDISFLHALKTGALVYLFGKQPVWCTITQQLNKSNDKQQVLLYDNGLLSNGAQFHYMILGPEGELMQHDKRVPPVYAKWKVPLRFSKMCCSPQALDDKQSNDTAFTCTKQVLDFMQLHHLQQQVQINYINSIYPKIRLTVVSKPNKIEDCIKNLCLYQWKDKLYCTPFDSCWNNTSNSSTETSQLEQPSFLFHKRKTLEKHAAQMQKQKESVPTHDEQHMFKRNRSCAVGTMLRGTTLAYHLGLFDSVQEYQQICHNISQTILVMWPHHDGNQNLRALQVYCPGNEATFFCTLNARKHYQQSKHEMLQFQDLWHFLLTQYKQLKEYRYSQLQPILDKLKKKDCDNMEQQQQHKIHMFSRCYNELVHLCENQKLLYFQREDIFHHKFKLAFASFIHQYMSASARLQVFADRNNVPYSIRCKYFDLDNVRNVLTSNEPFSFNSYDDMVDLQALVGTADWPNDILAFPIIPEDDWHQLKWQPAFCPGQPMQHNHYTVHHVATRGLQLVQLLSTTYLNYCTWLMQEFGLDANNNRQTFSQLAYTCVFKKLTDLGGSLFQSPEKMKPYYDCFLRPFCHGGFCYSAATEIKQHDLLFQNEAQSCTAENIVEFDVISSYGAAASNPNHFPGGFCMAYFNNATQLTTVYATDTYKRYSSFEFITVYAIIHHYQSQSHVKIRSAFHSFASFQLFKVGPYIIDLALVLECNDKGTIKEIALFQLDGQYVHGCESCPPLKSYMGNKTLQQVREATLSRDKYIQQMLTLYNMPFSYHIITDCHDPLFGLQSTRQLYSKDGPLHHLVSGYSWLPDKQLTLHHLKCVPPELTFIVVCQGKIDANRNALTSTATSILGGCIPCQNNNLHAFENTTCQDTLLTQAWFDFLTQAMGFEVTQIRAVFFFKTCHMMPKVYSHLIEQRQTAKQQQMALKADMLKRLINVSCGYFGLNLNKDNCKTTPGKVYITNKLNNKFKILRHKFEPLGKIGKQEYYIKSTSSLQAKKCWQNAKTHLGSFIHIIEEGKLQLLKKLFMFISICQPYSVRLLYSNVDNLILALGTKDDTCCSIIRSDLKTDYDTFLKPILSGQEPGQLKLEWSLSNVDNWSFITPRQCIYVVNKNNINKFASITKDSISPDVLYTLAQNMLNKIKSTVVQTRRNRKMFNLDTCNVAIQFNK